MNLNLVPLGDRVLIRPHERPTQTESGILLSEHRKPDTAGSVVAVGTMTHPRKAEAEELANWFAHFNFDQPWVRTRTDATIELLRDLVRKEPSVKVGDYVLFSWQSGQEFVMDDERFLIMREEDLLAVVEEDEVNVA